MNESDISRRHFLGAGSSVTLAKLLGLSAPALTAIVETANASQERGTFAALSASDAADLAAVASRILPSDDTPGAEEAGVIYFMDAALSREMAGQKAMIVEGIAGLNESIEREGRFADLAEDAQDALLTEIEQSPFFNFAWTMTMFGMFSIPTYGGNKNYVGWKLLNFEGLQAAWQHPFGYYDRGINGEGSA